MGRLEAIKKVSELNPAGDYLPEMSNEELARIHGGGDVQGETTPLAVSSMLCVNVSIRMSNQKCAYTAGIAVSTVLSRNKC